MAKKVFSVSYESTDYVTDQAVWVMAATLSTAISKAQRYLKMNAPGYVAVTGAKLAGTVEVD